MVHVKGIIDASKPDWKGVRGMGKYVSGTGPYGILDDPSESLPTFFDEYWCHVHEYWCHVDQSPATLSSVRGEVGRTARKTPLR